MGGLFCGRGEAEEHLEGYFGVIILFLVMIILNYARYRLGESLGWFLGFFVGFPFSLWFVQKVGPEKPTKESTIAMFLFGPLIFAALLIVVLFL